MLLYVVVPILYSSLREPDPFAEGDNLVNCSQRWYTEMQSCIMITKTMYMYMYVMCRTVHQDPLLPRKSLAEQENLYV